MRKEVPSSVVSIAPMMDWTDRHCRFFHRILSPNSLLYTEMVTTGAIVHGDRFRHLDFDEAEHPLALQLGGSDPEALAYCARIGAEDYGYDQINLNCGCPSDRVQNGAFGACLMKEPDLVARCVTAMAQAVKIPVTVKCRIGIDDCDDLPFLDKFIGAVSNAGCGTFIIHARKAWLSGLSPKENREIPPLRYDVAAAIRAKYPHLKIILNGGMSTVEQMKEQIQNFDGVMIGREAYQNPYILTAIERDIFGAIRVPSREDVVERMIAYIAEQNSRHGVPVKSITRHMLGLFNGLRGGRHWRQVISEEAHLSNDAETLLRKAMGQIPEEFLRAAA